MTTQTEALKLALEAYLCREMPAGTVIGDPKWWVPKIANAIKEALAQQCVCGEPDSAGTHRADGPCLAPQPEQEPVGDLVLLDRDVIKQAIEALDSNRPTEWSAEAWLHSQATVALNVALNKPTATTPPQRKPQFKEFIKWAGAQGYDCAQTCNSDTGEWIVLNPMTADLWKAWQAAHIIKGEA